MALSRQFQFTALGGVAGARRANFGSAGYRASRKGVPSSSFDRAWVKKGGCASVGDSGIAVANVRKKSPRRRRAPAALKKRLAGQATAWGGFCSECPRPHTTRKKCAPYRHKIDFDTSNRLVEMAAPSFAQDVARRANVRRNGGRLRAQLLIWPSNSELRSAGRRARKILRRRAPWRPLGDAQSVVTLYRRRTHFLFTGRLGAKMTSRFPSLVALLFAVSATAPASAETATNPGTPTYNLHGI